MSRGMGYDVFPVTARALQSPSRASGIPAPCAGGDELAATANARSPSDCAVFCPRCSRLNPESTSQLSEDCRLGRPAGVGQAPRQAPSCPRTVVLHGSVLPCGCAHHLRLYYRPAIFPRTFFLEDIRRGARRPEEMGVGPVGWVSPNRRRRFLSRAHSVAWRREMALNVEQISFRWGKALLPWTYA